MTALESISFRRISLKNSLNSKMDFDFNYENVFGASVTNRLNKEMQSGPRWLLRRVVVGEGQVAFSIVGAQCVYCATE